MKYMLSKLESSAKFHLAFLDGLNKFRHDQSGMGAPITPGTANGQGKKTGQAPATGRKNWKASFNPYIVSLDLWKSSFSKQMVDMAARALICLSDIRLLSIFYTLSISV